MNKILAVFLFSFGFLLHSASAEKIIRVDHEQNQIWIYGESGRLYRTHDERLSLISKEFEPIEKNGFLIGVKFTPVKKNKIITPDQKSEPNQSFEPSVISSSKKALEVFLSQATDWLPTYHQCYQLAHVWAYEIDQKYKLKGSKMFLFFTRKYIREYNFNWWFHVAPAYLVQDQLNSSNEFVFDRVFMNAPVAKKTWTDRFVKSRADCKEVSKFSDYENHQEEADCYTRTVPMYYYQPLNVEELDEQQIMVSDFTLATLNHAYRAFDR